VNKPDTDVVYHILYQKPGDPTWFVFTNTRGLFEHAAEGSLWHQTTDLTEAMTAAQGLLDRTVFLDSRPKYQHRVAAAQVYQTITTGGALLTFGTPQETEE
jgi:hypothetical protein